MKDLNPQHIRRYFESRLSGQKLASGAQVSVRCPWHDDKQASLSLNLEKGLWRCFAGCGDGGLLDFEVEHSKCDRATAWANICQLVGIEQGNIFSQKPTAIYEYQDALGRTVFQKLRFEPKRFVQRRANGKGWEYKLGDCQKPLYRLPEVLTADQIIVCEGEKDADTVRALDWGEHRVAATTNFDGAGKWRDEYAIYFAGKRVIVLSDNDDPGRRHAEAVAQSVAKYALGVRIVNLPNLPEKGDVSDFLKTHCKDDLLSEIKKAPQWRAAVQECFHPFFATGIKFISDGDGNEVDWMIENVIQRGSNGFLSAVPKGGKSWVAADMALSLAMGVPWLGFNITRAVRVALISREDNPHLTKWRLRHLALGKEGNHDLIDANLYVNTRQQTPELMLDDDEQSGEAIAVMKARQIEFAIFDVFNVMHTADENDNTEMRKILRQLSRVQTEVGCGLGVVHHFNKADTGSLTQRLRGSSAIAGWAEWLIGISLADDESKVRRMEFELKAAAPPDPVHFRILSTERDGPALLERADALPVSRPARRGQSAAERILAD